MSLRPWREVGRELLARFKIFDVVVARRESPRTGAEHGFFLVETRDWVNVIALTGDDELVLVRQYRHGPREFTVEIPGGCIDPGEDPGQAAVRELREETGYATEAEPVRIGAVNPNPALFTNRCHTYLLEGCQRVGEVQPDPGEDLEVVTLPVGEVERRVRAGDIDHALVLNGLYYLRLHREG